MPVKVNVKRFSRSKVEEPTEEIITEPVSLKRKQEDVRKKLQ